MVTMQTRMSITFFLHTVPVRLDQAAVYSGFRIMDEDGDGELSKQELIDHLTNYGERMSADEVEAVDGLSHDQLVELREQLRRTLHRRMPSENNSEFGV